MDTNTFIIKAKQFHGDKYDYSLVNYIGAKETVKIICSTHGIFEQTPDKHYQYSGCRKCSGRHIPTTNEFIEKAKKIHSDKYDYSLVEYQTSNMKIKIICPIHGEFEQTPASHLRGSGCWDCGFSSRCDKSRSNISDFINKAKKIHGDKYDYSLFEYFGNNSKSKIICNKHGEFEQTPHNHLKGHGCPHCRESKGEKIDSSKIDWNKTTDLDIINGRITYKS